jgi:hypothetical protein
MQDFKKTTEAFSVNAKDYENTLVRAEYGFSCIAGNSGPYFAVTAEEWYCSTEGKPRGREPLACGMLHDRILSIPSLAKLLERALPFHLFDPDRGPMHYEANGLYWLEMYDGKHERRTYDPDPVATFKSHVCFGSLAGDSDAEIESVLGSDKTTRVAWLAARLPRLREAFRAMVAELGMTAELDLALTQYASAQD